MLRLRWDLCIMLIIIYGSFYYPIELAFESETAGLGWLPYSIDKLALLLFWVDILLNFRTTYMNEQNEEIVSGKMIAKKYLKSLPFALDITSALPVSEITEFIQFENGNSFQVLLLFKVIRLLRMNRIVKYIKQDSLKNAFKLGKLFIYFFIMVIFYIEFWALKNRFIGSHVFG
jgi:Ion transport protein